MKLRLTATKKVGTHVHARVSAKNRDQWVTNGILVFSDAEWRELKREQPDVEVRDPLPEVTE